MRAGLGYASRTYRRGPDDLGGWKAVLLQGRAPDGTRSGVMFPIEDDRWMLTLGGMNGDLPPTDDAGFLAFARTLRSPVLADVVERLEPLSPIAGFRRIDSRRAHFDRMRRLPDGLLVAGDAACAFNPVYAQGMKRGGDGRPRSSTPPSPSTAAGQAACWPAPRPGCNGPSPGRRTARGWCPPARTAGFPPPTAPPTRCPTGSSAVTWTEWWPRRGRPGRERRVVDVVAMMRPPTSLLRPALSTRVLGRRHPAAAGRPRRCPGAGQSAPPRDGPQSPWSPDVRRIVPTALTPSRSRRPRPSRISPAHALVVGAGMAGLAAAQALSRHVERVTLVERDDLPDRPTSQAGVPHGAATPSPAAGRPGGPGAAGPGVRRRPGGGRGGAIGLPADLLWLTPAGWMTRFPPCDRHVFMSASRELIEWTFRRRVLEAPQVVVRSGLEVRGLEVDGGRVRGVAGAVGPGRRGRAGGDIEADLVVDASGRRSPAPAWLAAHGVTPPEETTVDTRIAYASRVYRRTAGDSPGWKGRADPGRAMAATGRGAAAAGGRPLAADADQLRRRRAADRRGRVPRLRPHAAVARRRPGGGPCGAAGPDRRVHPDEQPPPLVRARAPARSTASSPSAMLVAVNPVHARGMSVAALAAGRSTGGWRSTLRAGMTWPGSSAQTQRAVARAGDGVAAGAAAEGGRRGRGRARGAVQAAVRARPG